ncbi:MAG: hypothetical protein VYC68_01250, partial [Candidatus Thermoplasmatota archaeon]|nr:hypothetical protein [Candidatus Thermoplasmatota archaeon]
MRAPRPGTGLLQFDIPAVGDDAKAECPQDLVDTDQPTQGAKRVKKTDEDCPTPPLDMPDVSGLEVPAVPTMVIQDLVHALDAAPAEGQNADAGQLR